MRVAALLAIILFPLLAGCLEPSPTQDVSRSARGVRSVTWSVRENGTWEIEPARQLAEGMGFSTEAVGEVLLVLDGDIELLRFTPRAGGLVVTLTRVDPRVVPPGLSVSDVAQLAQDAYASTADVTLRSFEETFGWARQGDGSWSHATYRPSVADPLRPERRTLGSTSPSP